MIKLKNDDFKKMLHHAIAELPNEACGLIAGVKDGTDKVIKKVYLLTNTDHSNEHFSLDLWTLSDTKRFPKANVRGGDAAGIH